MTNFSFDDYCNQLLKNINGTFTKSNSPCNKFYSKIYQTKWGADRYCLLCEYELDAKEIIFAKSLVFALKDYMKFQVHPLNSALNNISSTKYGTDIQMISREARLTVLREVATETILISLNVQLMGRKNLHYWISDFQKDVFNKNFIAEGEVLKVEVIEPAIKIVDNYLKGENGIVDE